MILRILLIVATSSLNYIIQTRIIWCMTFSALVTRRFYLNRYISDTFVHIYVHLYIFMYIYIYLCIFTYIYVYLYIFMYICNISCIHKWCSRLSVHEWVTVSTLKRGVSAVFLYVHILWHICIYIYIISHTYTSYWGSLYVHLYIFMYICEFIHICVYLHYIIHTQMTL